MEPIKKNSEITLEIESLAYGGMGVARAEGFVIFVQKALPGDRVRARILKKAKSHAEAVAVAIERPSPDRVPAPCPLFGTCGGCSWQDLPYEKQLEWKRKQVAETLERLSGIPIPEVAPIIPSPEPWRYRNKMEYSFGPEGEETVLGFHLPGRYDKIFNVPACLIQPEPFDALLGALLPWARERGLTGYNQKTHQGFLRHAMMRHSRTTGGAILALITSPGELPDPPALVERLRAACPALQGLVWGTNDSVADVAVIQKERFRWGDPVLKETINGLTFSISPQSFFQTNTAAGEILYKLAVEMAQLGGADRVLDAYCGAGAIGLHCASRAAKVAGVEIVKEAVWDARANAAANRIGNSTFIAAPLFEGLELARRAVGGDFTRVIIDPPRGGMDKRSLAQLIALQAPVFVYVSCNPSTLARDLQTIAAGGYVAEAVQPVDMFPHTYHIETVVRLRRAT